MEEFSHRLEKYQSTPEGRTHVKKLWNSIKAEYLELPIDTDPQQIDQKFDRYFETMLRLVMDLEFSNQSRNEPFAYTDRAHYDRLSVILNRTTRLMNEKLEEILNPMLNSHADPEAAI